MKTYRTFLTLIIGCLLAIANPDVMAEPSHKQSQRKARHDDFPRIYVGSETAPIFDRPSAVTPVERAVWMQVLILDTPRQASAPEGWLAVVGYLRGPNAGYREPTDELWARREDIVLPEDFRRVVNCWPITRANYESGEYSAEMEFRTDGAAIVKEWGDLPSLTGRPEKAHLYMARGIIELRTSGPNPRFILYAGYREPQRQLLPKTAFAGEEYFPMHELHHCKSFPTLGVVEKLRKK